MFLLSLCERRRQIACVLYPSIKRERGVVLRAGRSYLSLWCVSVTSYKFRIVAVMSKAFHGVINFWQETWLFYQTNIFTISFLCTDVSLVSQCITGFCFYLAWFCYCISHTPPCIQLFPSQITNLCFFSPSVKGKHFVTLLNHKCFHLPGHLNYSKCLLNSC